MTPEAALDRVVPRGWRAQLVGELHRGATSRSYLVAEHGARYVLRVDEPLAATLRLDREREYAVLQVVSAAGLGPAPVACWPGPPAILLRPFLPGRAWTALDLQDPGQLGRLAATLRRVHAVPVTGVAATNIGGAIKCYAELLGESGRRLISQARAVAVNLGSEPVAPVLCHNDLVAANVLETDELHLIDWEFAGAGDPLFDLAVVIQHHELSEAAAAAFITAYLTRAPTAAEIARLAAWRRLYDVLLVAWLQVSL